MNGLISISILLILVSRCHTNWTSEWEDVVENYVKNELSQTIRICVEFDSIETFQDNAMEVFFYEKEPVQNQVIKVCQVKLKVNGNLTSDNFELVHVFCTISLNETSNPFNMSMIQDDCSLKTNVTSRGVHGVWSMAFGRFKGFNTTLGEFTIMNMQRQPIDLGSHRYSLYYAVYDLKHKFGAVHRIQCLAVVFINASNLIVEDPDCNL